MLNVTGNKIMAKQLSTHAAAAKMIRQHLKAIGVPAKVKASSYSMGSSVRVEVCDITPTLLKELSTFVDQFQYGHFDGMNDYYEISNSRDDIPQVKYTFLEVDYSDELEQKAYDFICNRFSVGTLPASYKDVSYVDETTCGSRIRNLVDWTLTGKGFENTSKAFWESL